MDSNVFAMKDFNPLAYNVYVKAFKLETYVIDVLINLIQNGNMENVGANQDLQLMETNVLEIKLVQIYRNPVMLELSSISNRNVVFRVQRAV